MKKSTLYISLIFGLFFSFTLIAQSTATYDITFQSSWNASDHGTLPGNAHWSNLVGATHNSSVTFLEMGQQASPGIEDVAELGSNSVFNSEVTTAINAGNAGQWLNEPFSPFAAISSATLSNITVTEDFPLISLASMIAPSPDWMIAVNSISLWDSNMSKWKESFTVDLFPYDAGTENGLGYSGNNPPTDPQGVISNVAGAAGYPFNSEKIGTLTVTFISSTLSTPEFEQAQSVTIFPNPTDKGYVTLKNATSINSVKIYDVLGKQVKQFLLNSESEKIVDISNLKTGIYIVRLIDGSGNSQSKKLVIR